MKQSDYVANFNDTAKYCVCSLIAGLFACLATHPFWVLQTHMAIETVNMLRFFIFKTRKEIKMKYED
jgi:hypothetical protein